MFKTVNRQVPACMSEKFAYTNSIHRQNLRGSQHNLLVPRPYTDAFKKCFWYRGAVLWNSLSVEAKQTTSLNNFLNLINVKLGNFYNCNDIGSVL